MQKKRLRIGIICGHQKLTEPWMLRLANQLHLAPELEFAQLIVRSDHPDETVRGVLGPLWSIESKLAKKVLPSDIDQLETLLPPSVAITDIDAIRSSKLDVILDLSPLLGLEIAPELANFGVWYLDFLRRVVGADSVQAIISADQLIELKLNRRCSDTKSANRISTISLQSKSIAGLNHLYLCEKSVSLILRELKRAHLDGEVQDLGSMENNAPASLSIPMVMSYLVHVFGDVARRFGNKIGSKLGLRPGMFYLQTSTASLETFDPAKMTSQPVSGNTYYADPFLWEKNGETYCFFEIYDYKTSHGHLGVGRMERGILTETRSIIKSDYHMSYPFVFEYGDQLYMMPETCGAKRLELWKCIDFPDRWERDRTILDDVVAADSSIAKINDEWWLFTNISTDPFGEMNSELHLYKIDGPDLKQLEPHPLNPVVFDTRTARNAGRIHVKDGMAHRVSQNNSHGHYGYGLNLMKIHTISMTKYVETLEREVKPIFKPGLIGCHHVDVRNGLVVMDVCKRLGGRAS